MGGQKYIVDLEFFFVLPQTDMGTYGLRVRCRQRWDGHWQPPCRCSLSRPLCQDQIIDNRGFGPSSNGVVDVDRGRRRGLTRVRSQRGVASATRGRVRVGRPRGNGLKNSGSNDQWRSRRQGEMAGGEQRQAPKNPPVVQAKPASQ